MATRSLLAPGVLAGRDVAVAGGSPVVAAACEQLGAHAHAIEVDLLDEEAVAAAAAGIGTVHAVVADARGPFAGAGGGYEGLRAALDGAFNVVRAVANAALIPAERGKVVLIAPAPGAGDHAAALRAALENLARTLSTEWARYGVTAVAVLTGDATTDDELVELTAFLVSPAGDYYSGCALALGAAAA
jgi:NAD(P)-dependent dehydrogenase (short-subunit alcohol dehydrogenase family)